MSYQERLSGNQAPSLYAISLIVVFLCLAALYESWSIPFSVMLVVPLGVVGALLAATFRGLTNDVYFQVGLLTTIGLSAKNAILIVEFAKDLMEKEGKGLIEATLEAVRMRLRPILMTSLAFILGVMPLVISSGAGSGAQNAVGTGVMGGMVTGRRDDAIQVLNSIGGKLLVEQELPEMESVLKAEQKKEKISFGELFRGKTGKIVLIGTLIAAFQQITGINAVIMFAPDIFQAAGSAKGDSMMQAMIVGLVNFLMTIVALGLVDKKGRKTLLLWGAVGMIVSLAYLTFEFERYELLILVHALDHPGARSAPVVPDADAHTVVPKLRNLQKTTDEEALQLAGASSVDLCTEAGDAAGEVACPESLVELLPLKESGDSFDRTSPALVQKFPFALTRRIERRVARRCFLPRFNDVRKFR
jgi:uncharacterized membrane protein